MWIDFKDFYVYYFDRFEFFNVRLVYVLINNGGRGVLFFGDWNENELIGVVSSFDVLVY